MKANLDKEIFDIKKMMSKLNESFDSNDMGSTESNTTKVMDFAYAFVDEHAPDGPRNADQYMGAIKKLEHEFDYAIRNLKGNVGGGSEETKDMPGFEGTMDGLDSMSIR
jgi:hypothetical protein